MKYISVPKSKAAMERLEYDECTADDLVEEVLDSQTFQELWSTGIFHKINAELNVLIDEFEDESITGCNLIVLKSVTDS